MWVARPLGVGTSFLLGLQKGDIDRNTRNPFWGALCPTLGGSEPWQEEYGSDVLRPALTS